MKKIVAILSIIAIMLLIFFNGIQTFNVKTHQVHLANEFEAEQVNLKAPSIQPIALTDFRDESMGEECECDAGYYIVREIVRCGESAVGCSGDITAGYWSSSCIMAACQDPFGDVFIYVAPGSSFQYCAEYGNLCCFTANQILAIVQANKFVAQYGCCEEDCAACLSCMLGE